MWRPGDPVEDLPDSGPPPCGRRYFKHTCDVDNVLQTSKAKSAKLELP